MVKMKIKDFYVALFSIKFLVPYSLAGLGFKKVSVMDNMALVGPFTKEEIRAAVNSCNEGKAPGSVDFYFFF